MMWGSEEDEALAGIRKLFLDDKDIDCSVIVEEEEEEDLIIQTMYKGVVLKIWTDAPSRARRVPGVPAGKLLGFIVSRRGIELHPSKVKAIQDFPPPKNKKDAENPVDREYEPLETYFSDEEVSFVGEDITETYDGWRMFFNGTANFKGVGIGAVLVSETGQHYTVSAKLRFPCTNNMAEYEDCILGLKLAIDMNVQKLLIKHKNSTAYMPQMNGVVKASNKNIEKILRKMIDNHKQWHEKLPFALLGYRTTVRTSNGTTPYLLVYGIEAIIPTEVEIPSLRIIQEAELSDAEWIRSHYEQLDLIDGKRMNAVCHCQLYQNRMSRAFNKRVRPKQFTLGQLVLKRIFPHQDEAKGKFSPNWKGPYMVHRELTGEALILAEMEGEIWVKPINSDTVKRYYV
ncbi:uncharacterized protein [Nicotiana tomentosiformis]|uniref:uncharacterized protein n=1 Tax=Nicotiana tomentosiformis TaxID=4098 RepID=UPI00388C9527